MKRQSIRDRLFVNQWYIGSGSRVSGFTRRANRPFEEIKELYLMEIESSKDSKKTLEKPPSEQKGIIKTRVKKKIIKQNISDYIKSGLALLISIGIFTLLFVIAKYLIELYWR